MLSESIVIGFMGASVVGAGLVLAVYALIIPMSDRIFKELTNEIKVNLIEFDKLKSKITPDSKKEMKRLNKLRSNMENLKKLPTYLGIGVLITFYLYCASTFVDSLWLINSNLPYSNSFVGNIFITATVAFFIVGTLAIVMVLVPMHNEFEAITKKQKRDSSKNPIPSQK